MPALLPPEIEMDPETQKKCEQDLLVSILTGNCTDFYTVNNVKVNWSRYYIITVDSLLQ